jgi:glutathione S-transferase
MQQRISLITLGVGDLARARRFYEDGLGWQVAMTESAAICQYLASRCPESGLDVAASDPAYGDYLNFLHFGEATLTFPQALVLRYGHFEPPERRQPQVVEDYTRWFLSRLRTLEPRLARGLSACPGR